MVYVSINMPSTSLSISNINAAYKWVTKQNLRVAKQNKNSKFTTILEEFQNEFANSMSLAEYADNMVAKAQISDPSVTIWTVLENSKYSLYS